MRKTVLIVEDEFLIALDLTQVLERRGWHVLGPVSSVKEALRLLSNEVPAVAILDLNLTDGLVTPVAEALRDRNVPFVVASAHSNLELEGGEVLAGVPNAGKPTDEHRLVTLLEASLNSSA